MRKWSKSISRFHLVWLLLAISTIAMSFTVSAATFSLSEDTSYYTVDTGGGLVFKIRRTNPSAGTQSAGDIASLVYNDVQYQDQTRGSQLNVGANGLYSSTSDVTVSAEEVDSTYIKITVVAGDLTHYYIAKSGEPRIYMATVFDSEPSLGLVRYIVRIPNSVLPNGPEASNIIDETSTVEASDVFGLDDGQTRSKHYSNQRLKDWNYIGATGDDVGIWIVRNNSEGMSGGPFYRSLLNQGASDQEITYIINYGMAQTEDYRTGILNTYTMVFTDGDNPPESIDTSWMSALDLKDYVASSARGEVDGEVSGQFTPASFDYTVGFSNSTAQYWADVSASDGSFAATDLLPGDYTMSIYKNELVVGTQSVTVSAGGVTDAGTFSVTDDPQSTTALWRVGNWDGSPAELLNGSLVTYMHPSDTRMSSWTPSDFVVDESTAAGSFPAYQWMDVNNPIVVRFNLTSDQIVASQVRIGVTMAYLSARPRIAVNSWTSSYSSAPDQPDTRSLTIGTYRGNNQTYTFTVPASALVVGENEMQISLVSGESGSGYLSPGVAYDAVDLIQ